MKDVDADAIDAGASKAAGDQGCGEGAGPVLREAERGAKGREGQVSWEGEGDFVWFGLGKNRAGPNHNFWLQYKIAESPIPSAEEESSSEDEEDGPRKPKVDPDDPVARE